MRPKSWIMPGVRTLLVPPGLGGWGGGWVGGVGGGGAKGPGPDRLGFRPFRPGLGGGEGGGAGGGGARVQGRAGFSHKKCNF